MSHLRREAGVDDAIHRGGEERDLQRGPVDRERDVDFRRVDRHATGDQGNLVEPIRAPGPLASAQLELHLEILQEELGVRPWDRTILWTPEQPTHHIWWYP